MGILKRGILKRGILKRGILKRGTIKGFRDLEIPRFKDSPLLRYPLLEIPPIRNFSYWQFTLLKIPRFWHSHLRDSTFLFPQFPVPRFLVSRFADSPNWQTTYILVLLQDQNIIHNNKGECPAKIKVSKQRCSCLLLMTIELANRNVLIG